MMSLVNARLENKFGGGLLFDSLPSGNALETDRPDGSLCRPVEMIVDKHWNCRGASAVAVF
jgi:hypothetical protein